MGGFTVGAKEMLYAKISTVPSRSTNPQTQKSSHVQVVSACSACSRTIVVTHERQQFRRRARTSSAYS